MAIEIPTLPEHMPNDALRCGLPGCEERETAPVSHVAMIHSRSVFEEVLGWILVPAFGYLIYLGVQAVGGIPKELIEFPNELIAIAMKGGKG